MKAVIVGSGPGGCTAAKVLSAKGWSVVIFEKGRNYFTGLDSDSPKSVFSSDELKMSRNFSTPDPDVEPRVFLNGVGAKPIVGAVNSVSQTVGGGTTHWDAKTPRFWDIDFKKLSMLGPIPGADVADWPFAYEEIAPFYDAAENLIGVAGDVTLLPKEPTLAHAPRTKPLPMPKGPGMFSSMKLAEAGTSLGLHPFPVLMSIYTEPFHGRNVCNNCGLCAGYGCPIVARGGALEPLRDALRSGAELRTESMVTKVNFSNRKAQSVTWTDASGASHTETADIVVLAANPIETVRLALLSGLPDPNRAQGRHLMFHWFLDGTGIFLGERTHQYRGRAQTHNIDDFADPDFDGARAFAKTKGLPYFRAGTIEMGGSDFPISEAMTYQSLMGILAPKKPFGTAFKELMRGSLLRDRLIGMQVMGEDLPYATNRVELDPSVKDWRGVPVPRVTYAAGPHELAATQFYGPWLVKILKAAGADVATSVPEIPSSKYPIAAGSVPDTKHVMGGMRMGTDPATSVTDGVGRHHQLDNVFVADGSVFPGAGGHNPTLTIIATTLRNADRWG